MRFRTRMFLLFGFLLSVLLLPAMSSAQTVKCESNDGRRQYCGAVNGRVSMQRQISDSPCIEGQTWGVDRSGLWVDRGCRAEFYIGNQGGPGRPDWNGGNDSGTITCESNDGRRRYCGGRVNPRRVSLQRQISQASCRQGYSWGVDDQGLWVDRGCRAIFEIGRWNGGGGGYPGGNVGDYPQVRCDTSGRGNFSSRNYGNSSITRGWVDTRSGRASVSLSGPRNFKITFYGDVVRTDGRRTLTIRITDSNRGRANGTADIYLNDDRNEVETINISGNNFNGNFGR